MSYIIKCEINGIQEFIFNIKSKGAAKALKARSFLVDALCLLAEENFASSFTNCKKIFTGGGNVYLEIDEANWDAEKFETLKNKISEQLIPYQILFSGTYEKLSDENNFGKFIQSLNEKLNREKLQFGKHSYDLFEPRQVIYKDLKVYREFSKSYSENISYTINDENTTQQHIIGEDFMRLQNKILKLNKGGVRTLIPLPLWNHSLIQVHKEYINKQKEEHKEDKDFNVPEAGDIISFEDLAYFSKQRTGTDNIGVLKLDIDNLGKLFQALKARKPNQKLSERLRTFFTNNIIALLNKEIKTSKDNIRFSENIYTVYAGGDDCFFIGAWDAITEFAILLKKDFEIFEQSLRKDIPSIEKSITLSAAVIIVDAHFPVVRFAELAEDALKTIKNIREQDGEKLKNRISFMGRHFSWDEFAELVAVKNTLNEMIDKDGIAKAFLQRIIHSFENSDTLYWQQCTPAKPFDPAILWRFHYSFRDIRHNDTFKKKYYDTFFSQSNGYYKKYVWSHFSPGKELSQIMPVAARWAELLNRNKN